MYIAVLLYCLGTKDKEKSVYFFSTGATIVGLNIVYVSNNVAFFLKKKF